MNDAWCTCGQCDNEYKLISATQDKPLWCPFCGSEIDSVEEDIIETEEEDW
jgi:Zn finger protein HypA/HybF involved in hydrogenase expression